MASGETSGHRRFNGESLDPREFRRWRLWAEAKMASTKDMAPTHRGPFVLCLLDGVALEAVEHLTLDRLKEENGEINTSGQLVKNAFLIVFPVTGLRVVNP